jgi:hypothetical protein
MSDLERHITASRGQSGHTCGLTARGKGKWKLSHSQPAIQAAAEARSSVRIVGYRELESIAIPGARTIRSILIPQGVTAEQLVALADVLHDNDRSSQFYFFDSDGKYEELRQHLLHYPSLEYPYPDEWARRHFIAMLNRFGSAWELHAEAGGLHFGDRNGVIAKVGR